MRFKNIIDEKYRNHNNLKNKLSLYTENCGLKWANCSRLMVRMIIGEYGALAE
jgi:hypothetical protein